MRLTQGRTKATMIRITGTPHRRREMKTWMAVGTRKRRLVMMKDLRMMRATRRMIKIPILSNLNLTLDLPSDGYAGYEALPGPVGDDDGGEEDNCPPPPPFDDTPVSPGARNGANCILSRSFPFPGPPPGLIPVE